MTEQPPLTFWYAPEIELAAVSLLWHQPKRCAAFFQALDPAVHLREPKHRIIAQAIHLAWSELGECDWASVIQAVRELGGFEECGGAQGLNFVYSAAALRTQAGSDRLFAHYIQMLKTYAQARQSTGYFRVARFTGGSGTLALNKAKRNPSAPDYLGSLKVASRTYWTAAWLCAEGLSVKILPT